MRYSNPCLRLFVEEEEEEEEEEEFTKWTFVNLTPLSLIKLHHFIITVSGYSYTFMLTEVQ